MSSLAEDGILLAPLVLAPAAVVLGAGWAAYQGGKLLVGINGKIDESIRQQMDAKKAREDQRKAIASQAYERLKGICEDVLSQTHEKNGFTPAECAQLRGDLQKILTADLPQSAAKMEEMCARGYMQMEAIVRKQKKIAGMMTGRDGFSSRDVAGLLGDMKAAFGAIRIFACAGQNVTAPDPQSKERAQLNERFIEIAGAVMNELMLIARFDQEFPITQQNRSSLDFFFDDADEVLKALYDPAVQNQVLKRGLDRLEERLDQYTRMIRPGIIKEQRKCQALYQVYRQSCMMLKEDCLPPQMFKNAAELEKALKDLEKRVEQAKKCREILEKLGGDQELYVCLAVEMELMAMGYKVQSNKEQIKALLGEEPENARIGNKKLKEYALEGDQLAQFFRVAEDYDLQMIVHPDGSVSIQTMTTGTDEAKDEAVRRTSCSKLKGLHERLKKNWMITFESASATEEIVHVDEARRHVGIQDGTRMNGAERAGSGKGKERTV